MTPDERVEELMAAMDRERGIHINTERDLIPRGPGNFSKRRQVGTPTFTGHDWVYLAGPMTGIPQKNHPAFAAAAEKLRLAGHKVICPAEFDPGGEDSWYVGMRFDIEVIARHCHAIAVLDGFETSKGANMEMVVAMALGLDFIPIPGQTDRHVTYRRLWAQTSLVQCWRKCL